jgi:REP element-mobilizing transposase RayT
MKANDESAIDPVEKAGLPTYALPGGFRRGKSRGRKRVLGMGGQANSFHVMSRTTGGEHLFGEVEKEAFVRVMRRLERFAGVEVMTYAVMANHFHLLVRVPDRAKFLKRFEGKDGEAKLLKHLSLLYSKGYVDALRHELSDLRSKGMKKAAEDLLERFRSRFCDLPHFVKELKERFSRWFNKHHGRKGTLWMDRYKSVLVQDGDALRTMAAYIDLNPVRAGLVEDPKDYRWCGYAEAMGGSKRARRGLCRVLGVPIDSWEAKGREAYRRLILSDGIEAGEAEKARAKEAGGFVRRGFDRKKALEELQGGRKLSRGELIRCRVRYFSDGLVLGSRDFVEEAFQRKREWFGSKRKSGARGLPESEGKLFAMRDLKVRALE